MSKILCKFRGMLITAEVKVRSDDFGGKCPECGSKKFYDRHGWTECDCGFAYLTSDLNKVMKKARSLQDD